MIIIMKMIMGNSSPHTSKGEFLSKYIKNGVTPFLAALTIIMYLIIMVRTAIVFNHGTLFGILFIIVCPFFAEVWMANSKKTVYLGGYTGD